MANKDSFILYTEQKAVLDKLTDEQAGKLIKAIYEYEETGVMPQLDSILDLVITPFKLALDKNSEKWQETKQKRSEAGKMGAEVKKQKQAKQANANFDKQDEANQAVNVNDNVNVNVNDNVNVNVNASDSCVDGLYSELDLHKIINFYEKNIGLISPYGLEVLTDYAREMPQDLIVYAMQKAVEANVKTIQYIKGILNNWSKRKIKTLIEAKEEDIKFKNKNLVQEETEEERIARKIKEMEETNVE